MLLAVAIRFSCCMPHGDCTSIKKGGAGYIRCGKLEFEGKIWARTFGGTLFTLLISWLTIDGLCCGKRQLLKFGTNCWPSGILVIFGTVVATGSKTLFTWLVLFWKIFWTGGWLIKVACGMGAGDLRCKYCVRDGKGIRMSGFGVELLSVWTSQGAWVQGIIYCGGWIICSRKRNWVAFGARRTELICCRGRYSSRKCSQADLMFHIPWIFKFEVVLVGKKSEVFLIYLKCDRLCWNGLLN